MVHRRVAGAVALLGRKEKHGRAGTGLLGQVKGDGLLLGVVAAFLDHRAVGSVKGDEHPVAFAKLPSFPGLLLQPKRRDEQVRNGQDKGPAGVVQFVFFGPDGREFGLAKDLPAEGVLGGEAGKQARGLAGAGRGFGCVFHLGGSVPFGVWRLTFGIYRLPFGVRSFVMQAGLPQDKFWGLPSDRLLGNPALPVYHLL